MRNLNRREFLQNSALLAGVAGTGLSSEALYAEEQAAKERGPNETLRVALVGLKGRGNAHLSGLANRHGCKVTTVCDVDSAFFGSATRSVQNRQGKNFQVRTEKDVRKLVEDPNIDIISIATPNHWHALAAILALQNGKHVYVEKPVSHNVSEGRRIVEAAAKYNRICQAGTQIRSMPGIQQAIKFVQDGKLGKIKVARGLCYKRRNSIGLTKGPQPLPKTVDYDLWLGPAPKKPLRRKRLHYDWHWIWDYGNGDLGNQGIHQMDVARWALGKSTLSDNVLSVGGRFGYKDDGETANTQLSIFDYGDAELIFEVRGLKSTNPYPYGVKKEVQAGKNFVGNIIECEDGTLVIPDYGNAYAFSKTGEMIKKFGGNGDHFKNFVEAVRNNDPKKQNGPIEEGHLSSALCHLANISYLLGSEQSFDSLPDALSEDKEALETYKRTLDHLKMNGVTKDSTKYTAGPLLKLNVSNETFQNNKKADAMLTREYRKGFEVPKKI